MPAARSLAAIALACIPATPALSAVRFDTRLTTQLWMNSSTAARNGGWLTIESAPSAMAASSILDLPGRASGWITPTLATATRTPDRPDAALFESNFDVSGLVLSTAEPASVEARFVASQSVVFTDTRADATADTHVRFDLFVSWLVTAGSEAALDGTASASAGWLAFQSDPAGPIASAEYTRVARSAEGVIGHTGLWSYAFDVLVPAGGSTTLEFFTYVDGAAESASVPSAGSASLFALGVMGICRRRR